MNRLQMRFSRMTTCALSVVRAEAYGYSHPRYSYPLSATRALQRLCFDNRRRCGPGAPLLEVASDSEPLPAMVSSPISTNDITCK